MKGAKRKVFLLVEEHVRDVGSASTQSTSTIHGVYSTEKKAGAAMEEMTGRDCAFTADNLSIEEWGVDPVDI